MRKALTLVYGVSVYAFFGLTWAYFVGFLGGFPVPKGVDSGPVAPLPEALAVDLGALALFAAHHSIMARERVKRALARLLPPAIERSTYVLAASLAMGLLMAVWRPLPATAWQARGAARAAVGGVFWLGVLVTLAGSHTIDGLALFGVRQALAFFRGRTLPSTPFRTPGLYRVVRHPMMTGMLMTFWAAPTMTRGRLLLAAVMSGYILAAVRWLEERDLRNTFGADYERYQRQVPMLLPVKAAAAKQRSGAHPEGA